MTTAASRAAELCTGMVAGYEALKALDPNHPVWMNHAPRNSIPQLAAFDKAADIVGCDIYPVPRHRTGHSDLGDRDLTSVGAFTDRMQAAAPGKPVWMVLQGFGWSDIQDIQDERKREEQRRPRADESRFMAYDAISHGARGLLYWGTAYIEKDSPFWQELLDLFEELHDLQPVLAARDASLDLSVEVAETWGSVDRGVLVLAKEVEGEVWLIVVNEWPEALRYAISGLAGLDGRVYSDTRSDEEVVVRGDRLSQSIVGHGVQVYAPVKK